MISRRHDRVITAPTLDLRAPFQPTRRRCTSA